MEDLTRYGPNTPDKPTGASQLVLSGELTEGVSDLSEAMTAPGGVPALREVNQDRSHPDAPFVEEQAPGNYRRLVSGPPGGQVDRGWLNVSGGSRSAHRDFAIRPHQDITPGNDNPQSVPPRSPSALPAALGDPDARCAPSREQRPAASVAAV
jgi:hypothetical protein